MVSPKAKKDKIDGKKMFICDRHQKIKQRGRGFLI